MTPQEARSSAWLALSGMVALGYEMIWLRRLGLWLGGTSVAAAVTLGAFMAGLALGASWVDRARPSAAHAARHYALCELTAALWALLFPSLLAAARWSTLGAPDWTAFVAAFALLIPPSAALGATWPLLTRPLGSGAGATLYAANTTGAVFGVLGSTFLALPWLGVRGTELLAAALGLGIGVWAWLSSAPAPHPGAEPERIPQRDSPPISIPVLGIAAAAAGIAALGLEMVWFRLAATALGATVQANGWVLAVFLATMAAGAAAGRRLPRDPVAGLALGLTGLGVLALGGALAWSQIPYVVGGLYRLAGPEYMLAGSAVVAAVAMAGAPAASGLAFSCAVRCLGSRTEHAGRLYAANTVGSIVGATAGGLWAIPVLELRGALWLFAGLAVLGGAQVSRRPWGIVVALGLAALSPRWDARLYAVGVHVRISDFADPSRSAIAKFAAEGWDLVSYDHGATAAVAVGRSTRTGNLWLSINGKVDASTGDDMPTQVLSGQLPTALSPSPDRVLLVGLASGITAGAILADPRVQALTVAEIEPAVVDASRHFDGFSGAPLDDPRTTLVVRDARALLARSPTTWDVIVSEPSNPWISGVSSLFTLEYWELVRSRLRPDGIACQWLQLYGMGPDELRGLLRTFVHVFPDAVLVETIPGSDVLLIGGTGGAIPPSLAQPLLQPPQIVEVAGEGWLNTDDRPRVEWSAPRWLHYDTGPANAAALREAAGVQEPAAIGTVPP